jgi:hypothetical protein
LCEEAAGLAKPSERPYPLKLHRKTRFEKGKVNETMNMLGLGVAVIAIGFTVLILVVHVHLRKLRQELALLAVRLEQL